jgi:hypothetical protein
MQTEKSKHANDKGESRDAVSRCGRIRSSDEVPVMGMEQRDSVIDTLDRKQPEMGGNFERREIV